MAEIKNYYFGPSEVQNFATEVLKKVNVRISNKITSNILYYNCIKYTKYNIQYKYVFTKEVIAFYFYFCL